MVRYLQFERVSDEIWIYMEYVESDLRKWLDEFGIPPYKTYIHFAKQLIEGLHFLHEKCKPRIIHEDIKCKNILMNGDGVLKFADFGSSHTFNRTMTEIKSGRNSGATVEWWAPESIRNNNSCRKSDIWSLGCTLLELAKGKTPWEEEKLAPMTLMNKIAEGRSLPEVPEKLHENIKTLIGKCLKLDPDERCLTA